MIEAYKDFFAKYATFNGRTSRNGYWYVILMNMIIAAVLTFIDKMIDSPIALSYVYSLIVLIPGIAISVRRMHDINKSGAWILIEFVPVIGWIWFLVLVCKSSVYENNNY